MNKRIALAATACAVSMSLSLLGCTTAAEEPSVPINSEPSVAENASKTLTDEEKLKGLAVGESAVWRDYEVSVTSIERTEGKLIAHVAIKSYNKARTLSVECLSSFGMPSIQSSFSDKKIQAPLEEVVSGTLTFDDQYNSQRLFWNDGATEATWLLDIEPVQDETPASTPATEAKTDQSVKPTGTDVQKKAISALEAEIPSLITNNTYYEFRSLNSAAATVTARDDGGYDYSNTLSILDGSKNPTTLLVKLRCEANGNCIGMEMEGVKIF